MGSRARPAWGPESESSTRDSSQCRLLLGSSALSPSALPLGLALAALWLSNAYKIREMDPFILYL